MRRLSIRARITVGSVVVAAVVLVAIALVLHVQVRSVTRDSEVTLATSDLRAFVADLTTNPDETPDEPSEGVLVSIESPDGRTLVNSMPRDLHEPLERRTPGDVVLREEADGVGYTVVGERVDASAGTFQVWAARSGEAGDLTLRAIDRSLVAGSVLALAAIAVAAWLLATVSLRPVTRMRRAAESLSHEPGGDLLPVGPVDDELSALARTLNAFVERVRQSADRERQMVSDASHELRTPLAVLTTRLELAHRDFGDAAALERELLSAEQTVARLTTLASTLLELSRLESTEVGSTEVVTGADLVTEAMAAVDRARVLAGPGGDAPGSAVDLEVDVPDEAVGYPLSVTALGRVLDNLVANALSVRPAARSITVSVGQTVDRRLVVSVVDDGPGVPEDFLTVAFDRFSRADPSRASSGGSGLGLALVQAVARRAGGRATLVNEPGGGARATVTVPPRG
ncbi:HAMP domain-containing sensor histidine kinase [Frigoribacterium sp. Leaf186]|uniref:HAMP domain-containing sensor histidine kinase n=1 Tax=Frigoribacterium sp. Leaf186 TaxID=1736293 RepID=UPI0006FB5310|nr:HAMP domain-containing sensor histidine kinase [Frigoribacterium sp. Leaf186]KQS22339.1 hypothetical protein ASG05_01745 [Frigoribacterium sp. Leaf186]